MQNNYMCPKCKGYLNVGNSVVLSVASKNNQRGIVLLSSELGDYTTKHHSSLHFAEGEKVSFIAQSVMHVWHHGDTQT